MLCHQLTEIYRIDERNNFDPTNLQHGSCCHEPKVRPECQLSNKAIDLMHSGKDASILHMLDGGNGFPLSHYTTHTAVAGWDMGCTQERRDLRLLNEWQGSLAQCKADMKKGAIR